MKTENGETILYVNQYYEKNLDTGEETTYYYLGTAVADFLDGAADFLSSLVSPAYGSAPLDQLIAGVGATGPAYAVAVVVVAGGYVVCAWGPNIMEGIADWIRP